MHWVHDFLEASPIFAPLRASAAPLRALGAWPSREALQALLATHDVKTASGFPLTLTGEGPLRGEPYEVRIYRRGEMQVRENNMHDLFNVLAWLAYPLSKRALNHRHYLAMPGEGYARAAHGSAARGCVRDALTLFDESGAIVASSDAGLLDDLREFRWKRLFWDRRERVREHMRFFVFGHALFEKALRPYVGMTAHAILFDVPSALIAQPPERQLERLDALVAERIRDRACFVTPRALAPLPLLGVPGWWHENEREAFYDNTAYFRSERKRRGGAGARDA